MWTAFASGAHKITTASMQHEAAAIKGTAQRSRQEGNKAGGNFKAPPMPASRIEGVDDCGKVIGAGGGEI